MIADNLEIVNPFSEIFLNYFRRNFFERIIPPFSRSSAGRAAHYLQLLRRPAV
jgi:hypothetical protein